MKANSRNTGSANCSLPNVQKVNDKKNKDRSTKSHYVTKTDLEAVESPYKHSISEIKQVVIKNNEDDDFKTPTTIQKNLKIQKLKLTKNSRKKSIKFSTKHSENSVISVTEDNFVNLDVNPDNLQFALALSKSSYEMEYPQEESTLEEDVPYIASNAKKCGILKNFGFKCEKPKGIKRNSTSSDVQGVPKKRKISKFRFVTPTLILRTDEDREALITAKISRILSHIEHVAENCPNVAFDFQIFSQSINKYVATVHRIFNTEAVRHRDDYYIDILDITKSSSECGCLLKKWETIPGRDSSPKTSINPNVEENFTTNSQISSDNPVTCTSPDLFDSDNETIVTSNSDIDMEISAKFTKIYKTDSGIEHFVSSCDSFIEVKQHIEKNIQQKEDVFLENNCSTDLVRKTYRFESPVTINRKEDVTTPCNKNITGFVNNDSAETVVLSEDCSPAPPQTIIENGTSDILLAINDSEKAQISSNECTLDCGSDTSNTEVDTIINEDIHFSDVDEHNENESEKISEGTEQESGQRLEFKNYHEKEEPCRVSLNNTSNLNVTDYINQMLNKINSDHIAEQNENVETEEVLDLGSSSQISISQESIVISDDEFNYSSMKSKEIGMKEFYDLVSDEEIMQKEEDARSQRISPAHSVRENFEKLNEDLFTDTENYSQKSLSSENILISDDEFNCPSQISQETENRNFYDLCSSDEEHFLKIENSFALEEVTSELRYKYYQKNVTEQLPVKKSHSDENMVLAPSSPELLNNSNKPTEEQTIEIENRTMSDKSPETRTPKNNVYIKKRNVTPIPNYDDMTSPQIVIELSKYGVKPLKRVLGIQLLKYIYESTHPIISSEGCCIHSVDNDNVLKNNKEVDRKNNCHNDYSLVSNVSTNIRILGDSLLQNEREEDLIFEHKASRKMLSCAIPLQIVWYNFLNSNPEIQKSVLLYDPLQVEVVHLMLKEQTGFKFRLKDLMDFLDKKCITFRTMQRPRLNAQSK